MQDRVDRIQLLGAAINEARALTASRVVAAIGGISSLVPERVEQFFSGIRERLPRRLTVAWQLALQERG